MRTVLGIVFFLGSLVLAGHGLTACAPPKVLVDQAFIGERRTAKLIMQRSYADQFDQYIRICTLTAGGREVDCEDTLILEDVTADSVYP